MLFSQHHQSLSSPSPPPPLPPPPLNLYTTKNLVSEHTFDLEGFVLVLLMVNTALAGESERTMEKKIGNT